MSNTTQRSLTATQKKLHSLGLIEPRDFLLHIPLRYEDHSRIHQVADLQPGMKVQLEGTVSNIVVTRGPRKQLTATFKDQSGSLQLRWLHFYPSQKSALERHGLIRIRGEVRGGFQWGFEIIHPKILKAGEPLGDSLVPIYSTVAGLSQEVLTKAIAKHLNQCKLDDTLDEHIRERYQLMEINEAIQLLHRPPLNVDIDALQSKYHPAWERLKFDEMLAQQVAMYLARQRRSALQAYALETGVTSPLFEQVLERFGFALTGAQQRVIDEIATDMRRSYPMHRLVQGDVGSGKTIVAALAATFALEAGLQVALMAPTEILAEQHYQKISRWFEGSGVEVSWLASRIKASEKRATYDAIATGTAHFVIGTQALIQKDVQFKQLGLVIVDEQHRFGVGQRLSLSEKGLIADAEEEGSSKTDTTILEPLAEPTIYPHQLNMSATPIPRTLAMTFLSDLDVSVIDELPPGRQEVETRLIDNRRRDDILAIIEKSCHEGKQVYWVCPLVEESEALQLQTAEETFEQLQASLKGVRIALIHGRLKSEEKNQIMAAFEAHEIDLLVATTVIEVGVDVPNANIMVIEHAERFGLAQLHQLRGRVGRGQDKAICLLLYQQPLSALAKERLKAMYETTDGFEIARRDLEQRGPGEFLGLKQSGTLLTRFVDLDEDVALIEEAKLFAPEFVKEQREQAIAHQQRWVGLGADYLRS